MEKLFKGLDYVEKVGIVAGLAVMVVMNFLNVVCRFFLPRTPFSYTEELTNLIFVWITMLGVSMGYRTYPHTGLSLVVEMLPDKLQIIAVIFATACSIALMVIVIHSGMGTVMNHIRFNSQFPGLKIPRVWGSAAMPIGAILICFSSVYAAVHSIEGIKNKKSGQGVST